MLDGKNVAADELAGANGHLVISGSVTKNKLTDGDFEAYMVQATVLLDTVKCRNIQTEGATEANVGADKQLSYMKLPGQDLSFTIETDVTDFSMEGISLNAVPLAIHMEKPDTSELEPGRSTTCRTARSSWTMVRKSWQRSAGTEQRRGSPSPQVLPALWQAQTH